MVFVDYEYCFYSYQNGRNLRPEPRAMFSMLSKEFNVKDIMVFGDFTPNVIKSELPKLRNITNTIIETGNTLRGHKKDMTDFVMLDYIYQACDEHKDVDTYILYTGDGHFQSVIKHLINRKKKRVIVFGVKESISCQLIDVANQIRYIPVDESLTMRLYRYIAENMNYIKDKPSIIPSFNATVDAVARIYHVDKEQVRIALAEMIKKGYLRQRDRYVEPTRTVPVLDTNWDKMIKDGIVVN